MVSAPAVTLVFSLCNFLESDSGFKLWVYPRSVFFPRDVLFIYFYTAGLRVADPDP